MRDEDDLMNVNLTLLLSEDRRTLHPIYSTVRISADNIRSEKMAGNVQMSEGVHTVLGTQKLPRHRPQGG